MNFKKNLLITMVVLPAITFAQYDWDGIEVPAEESNPDVSWDLVETLSDDFNYEIAAGSGKGTPFTDVWNDQFINGWTGPGNTVWSPDYSRITGGNLELFATRNEHASGEYVNFQAISAKESVIYPVYIETNMKIMNSVMANAVWMLSDDSAEEIDIVEGYGSSYSESKPGSTNWFAQRMHLSHHTFDRSGFPDKDYQPTTESGTYYTDGTLWRDAYRTVGIYWKDPFHLEYYIDGEIVRALHYNGIASKQANGSWKYIYYTNLELDIATHSTSTEYSYEKLLAASDASSINVIDPHEYLGGYGLSKTEKLIFSGAAQGWQVDNGVFPTDNELATQDHIFRVDWIRTYKRNGGDDYVPPVLSSEGYETTGFLSFSNPLTDYITINSEVVLKEVYFYNVNGALVKSIENMDPYQKTIFVNDLPAGIYILKVVDDKGSWSSEKVIKK